MSAYSGWGYEYVILTQLLEACGLPRWMSAASVARIRVQRNSDCSAWQTGPGRTPVYRAAVAKEFLYECVC